MISVLVPPLQDSRSYESGQNAGRQIGRQWTAHDTIATFAEEMSEFLKISELTETMAFVHSFVVDWTDRVRSRDPRRRLG